MKQLAQTTIGRKLWQGTVIAAATVLVLLNMPMAAYAASSQQLYLSPNSYTPALGSEFSVAIRVKTTTPIDGITASVTFNPKLVQYVSIDATASAFPFALATQPGNGSISIDRGILGGTVSTDALVATVTFKALAPTAYTALGLKGNTTYQGDYTNPALVGAKVAIQDKTAPEVYALKPADGTKSSTSFSIGAASRDNVKIVKTEIYIDGVLVQTGTAWNIYHTWDIRSDSIAKGAHTVTAKAYDASGNVGSASVTLHKM